MFSIFEDQVLYFWIFLVIFSTFHNGETRNRFGEKLNTQRIINGEEASLGQFPWQVALFFTSSDRGGWFCGGTIISEEWILSAAHCVDRTITASAYAGLIDLDLEDSAYDSPIYQFIIHEDFKEQGLLNDIALLKLVRPLAFNENIKAIDLASDQLESDVDIVVSGWGQTSDDSSPAQTLNFATLSTIDNLSCDKIYGGNTIVDGMICALSKSNLTKATCFGDSGGPGIVYNNGSPVLVAISSFISDRGCEIGDPSGFTRVDYYREWIRRNSGV